MSLQSLLLRLLLCFSLLVSGSAQALALAHPAIMSEATASSATPCHESHDATPTALHLESHHSGPHSKLPDCCKGAVCDCACSHGAAAAMPQIERAGRNVVLTTQVSLPPTHYASPPLARLIRPPIV
jgi:hypothetical protein